MSTPSEVVRQIVAGSPAAPPDFPRLAPGETWCPACGGEGSRDGRGDADEPSHVRCALCDGRATVDAIPAPAALLAPPAAAADGHVCVVLDGVPPDAVAALCAAARTQILRHPGARALVTVTPAGEYPQVYRMGALGEMISLSGPAPEPGACDCGAPADSPGGILCVRCDRRLIDRT